jgi:alpha-galactosidase
MMLDDCWAATNRTVEGEITWDTTRFPNGMPALVEWVHQQGFKIAVYTSIGNTTCNTGGRKHYIPGSEFHYQQDINTFATWQIDGSMNFFCLFVLLLFNFLLFC